MSWGTVDILVTIHRLSTLPFFILRQVLLKPRPRNGIGDVEHEVTLRILQAAHLIHLAIGHDVAPEMLQCLVPLAKQQLPEARPLHHRIDPLPLAGKLADDGFQILLR